MRADQFHQRENSRVPAAEQEAGQGRVPVTRSQRQKVGARPTSEAALSTRLEKPGRGHLRRHPSNLLTPGKSASFFFSVDEHGTGNPNFVDDINGGVFGKFQQTLE